MGNLTTHVLDTAAGCPVAGIVIELYRLENDRILLTTVRTNNDGRCAQPLLADEDFRSGEYELVFHAGDIFLPMAKTCRLRRSLTRWSFALVSPHQTSITTFPC